MNREDIKVIIGLIDRRVRESNLRITAGSGGIGHYLLHVDLRDMPSAVVADHDGRYYTETELDAGQLDNRYYTETELSSTQIALGASLIGIYDVGGYFDVDNVEDALQAIVSSGVIDHANLINVLADQHHAGFVGLEDNAATLITPAADDRIQITDDGVINADAAGNTLALSIAQGQISHDSIADVSVDDHHAQIHKNAHKSGGGDAFANTDLLEAIVKRLQESGGPTTLLVGAVADGEYLKRDGAGIVGDVGGSGPHNLLDGDIHPDTVAQGVTEGSLVYGNATPKWDELVIGVATRYLRSDGSVPAWAAIPASEVVNTPAGDIAATDVQAALNELDTEKASTAHKTTHETGGGDEISLTGLLGVVEQAATVQAGAPAVQTGKIWLDTDATPSALAASQIVNTPAGGIAATDVQAAINELDAEKVPLNYILSLGVPTELTLVGGVITVTQSYHIVDTEDDDPADDLDTINGGSIGDLLILRTAANARDITLTNQTGNLYLAGADFTLSTVVDTITLVRFHADYWTELSRSDNA